MAGLITDLIDILNTANNSLNDLVELSKEKTDVIVANNMQELQKITELEQILTGRYQKLDRNREVLMQDIASVLNIKSDNITLTILADAIKEQKEASALLDVMERLAGTALALQEVNDNNRALVDFSLDYIDFSLNVIRSSQTNEPTLLTPQGEEITTVNQGGLFDTMQ